MVNPERKERPFISEDKQAALAGSVYLRQVSGIKQRTPTSANAGRKTTRDKAGRRSGTLHHAILISHIRTFALVVMVMFGLLFLSIYITGQVWQRHMARARQVQSPPPPPTEPAPGLGVMVDEQTDGAGGARVRTELDTDAMRRAILMQRRASALLTVGNIEEALVRLKEALEIWPHLTQGWSELGQIYLQLGDYSRAEVALERALETDPGNAEWLNDLGVALLYQNRIAQARDLFNTILDLNPDFAPAHFNLSLCYFAQGNEARAEEELDRFLRLQPDNPQALKEKAYLVASRGDYGGALTHLQKAIQVAPDWASLYVDAAAVTALMGRIDEVIRYLDRLEDLTAPDVVYRLLQQPAFRSIRLTEIARQFEATLAERAREIMGGEAAITPDVVTDPVSAEVQPMASRGQDPNVSDRGWAPP